MNDSNSSSPVRSRRATWNKGKMPGPKPPLRPRHVWAIREKLQLEKRIRDLAMFNLAIDSKLRGCDLVALRVDDVVPNGYEVMRIDRSCAFRARTENAPRLLAASRLCGR
jgi:hypothetical protein